MRLRARPQPRPQDVSGFLGASLVMAVVGAFLAPFVCMLFNLSGLGSAELILTALVAGLLVAARQSSDLLQAYGRAGRSILFLALGVLCQCLLFGFAVFSGHATLLAALACSAAGSAIQTVIGLRDLRDRALPRASLAWVVVSPLVRLGVPSVAYTLGLMISQRLDRLVIVGVMGSATAGVYAVAATMAEASRIIPSAVGQLLFIESAAAARTTIKARHTYRLTLVAQTGLVMLGWFLAPRLVPLLFGDAYLAAVPVVQLLFVAEMFMGIALMDARLLMGLHRVQVVACITAALVALAVPAYVVLVRVGGLLGAAQASLMMYLVYAAVLFVVRIRADREVPAVVI